MGTPQEVWRNCTHRGTSATVSTSVSHLFRIVMVQNFVKAPNSANPASGGVKDVQGFHVAQVLEYESFIKVRHVLVRRVLAHSGAHVRCVKPDHARAGVSYTHPHCTLIRLLNA